MRPKLFGNVLVVGLLLCGASAVCAGYTIDGDLSDWGVSPFVDWEPDSQTADYVVTDGQNTYNADTYAEIYDYEAMYFDDDEANFYFAVVASYPTAPETKGGDLGLDLNGDATISEHGVVTGLEYAIRIVSPELGDVVASPAWALTTLVQHSDGWQGSPWKAPGGDDIGTATVAINRALGLEDGTYILEIGVPKDIFPGAEELSIDDPVTAHMTMWCGNDSINLTGTIAVPEPATILLVSMGLAFAGTRRKRA